MPGREESFLPFELRMTDEALYGYCDVVPHSVYERIGKLIEALARFPHYGSEYDPLYPAARPPVPCRVFYCGHYGIYYAVDEDARVVNVLAVEDERRDPLTRFAPRDA